MDEGRDAAERRAPVGAGGADDLLASAMMAPDTPLVLSNPRLPDNPIIAANQAFCALTGYSAGEVIGRNCRFLQSDETDPVALARMRDAIAAAQPVEVVLLNRRRDGSTFWNRLLVAPILGPSGEVLYFFGSQRDVSAEWRRLTFLEGHAGAIEALARRTAAREAEEDRLRDSQRAAGAVSWDWNPRTGEILWGEGFAAVFGAEAGVGPRDFAGWLRLVHPRDRAEAQAGADAIRRGGGRFEYRVVRDGELRWLEAFGRVLGRDPAGEPERATGIVLDVTDRKAADERARESESRFRAIAEASTIIVFVTDAAGRNTYVSPQFASFTGLSEAALLGDGWMAAVAPEDLARARPFGRRSFENGEPYDVELRLRRHDRQWRWFLVRSVPVKSAGGLALSWCGTLTDIQEQVEAREALARSRSELERLIGERTAALSEALEALRFEATERARAEEALRQAQKMEAIGQLTGGIAHDFNNLLTAISGSLELLQTRLEQGRASEAEAHIAAARRAVDRGTGLTHRLLAFARQQALIPRAVAPDRLLDDLGELIRRAVGPQIEVFTRFAAGPGAAVLCDANQLESALLNLAINARDAMPSGGSLTLSTAIRAFRAGEVAGHEGAREGIYVEIAVADDGDGMTAAVRARAFDPFFTTKPVGQGTGLGLSQTYGFVRQSDGFVMLESGPGAGTTVRLLLPLHEGVGAPSPAPPPEPAAGRDGAIVLIVEDEETLRDLLIEVLEELGCTALSAADGHAGLKIVLSPATIDLLVTDVGLPGLNGRQLAAAAREARPELPVLFITGYVDEEAGFGEGLPAGMQMIGKPFTLAALAARISDMLGGAD